MIKKNLAIIGAGGYGRELFYLLDSNIYECVGFLEIKSSKLELPAPIIGSEGEIYKIIEKTLEIKVNVQEPTPPPPISVIAQHQPPQGSSPQGERRSRRGWKNSA